eukprot:scpid89955/ scgid9544/ 
MHESNALAGVQTADTLMCALVLWSPRRLADEHYKREFCPIVLRISNGMVACHRMLRQCAPPISPSCLMVPARDFPTGLGRGHCTGNIDLAYCMCVCSLPNT